ncbi:MAG: DUF6033 family protein [Roseburia sp.]|nr:DUF6033 family protein [Roseburia sp.]
MNGINYSTLVGNSSVYQSGSITEDIVSKNAAARTAAGKASVDTRQTNADKDTYESGQSRAAKAGYDRPTSNKTSRKPLDADGVQEGITLSDSAKKLLAELKEKYGNMSFTVAEWSSDEDEEYYASRTSKEYSVLINPELLEKMAADESVRAEYESVLSGAGDKFAQFKEGLGEDADKVTGFSISIDKDGKVSYAVKLMQDMSESSAARAKEQQARNAEKRQEERIQERRDARKKAEEERYEKLQADSVEELIEAVKNKLYPQEEQTNGMNIQAAAQTDAE